jgi:tRNA pseudouridine13 synthase
MAEPPETRPDPVAPLPYLTADLPGVGGAIKQRATDFMVEEQPLYEPLGQGEHLYLYIEKTGLTTHELVRRVARAFRSRKSNIGYAGLKDKHAVTRQHVSVHYPDPAGEQESLQRLDSPETKVLWTDRHTNKIKRGHHGGNRFVIYIRDVQPTHVLRARKVLDVLVAKGMPNFVGEQRFGFRNNAHLLGAALLRRDYDTFIHEMLGIGSEHEAEYLTTARDAYLRGDYSEALQYWPKRLPFDRQLLDALRQGKSPRDATLAVDANQRRFFVSALQSKVFNTVLQRRIETGAFDRLLAGDLAWKHDSGAVFAVDQATAELENGPHGRVHAIAVSPSGPMWGVGMTQAQGQPAALEAAALREHGLSTDEFSHAEGITCDGSRRSLRIALLDPGISGGVDEHGPYIRVTFLLTRGAFATIALREIMKSEDDAAGNG